VADPSDQAFEREVSLRRRLLNFKTIGSIVFAGALLFYPASQTMVYGHFLVALFILAGGLSVLETSANPYIVAMGPEETATRRLNLAQSFNPLGANIRVDSRDTEVMRILPRTHEEVNEEWISDKTRFVWDGIRSQRLDRPYVRDNGRLRPAGPTGQRSAGPDHSRSIRMIVLTSTSRHGPVWPSGHSTISSSALGMRSRVANFARASATIVVQPSCFAAVQSASAVSTAPKINSRGGTGSCSNTRNSVSRDVAAWNGGRPVRHSYRIAPRLYTSAAVVTACFCPAACSGAM
jgi:hypothetical protein